MRKHLRRSTPHWGRRIIPRLEALDGRDVPAGTVTFAGGTLTIVGDTTANIVKIDDAGTGAIGSVSVTLDGVTTSNTQVITSLSISVNTLLRADTVAYNLTGDLQPGQSRTLTADLGGGNDLFQATAVESPTGSSDLASGSSLSFNVFGQSGTDRLFFDFSKDVDVEGTAALIINANGGNDRDFIALSYVGSIAGTLTFNLNGDLGGDRISANVTIDPSSTGTVTGQVNGHGGNDLLALVVTKSALFTGTVTGSLAGGAGTDTAIASAFVDVTGVENLFRLPF